jgi:prepilin-type N-terminal cleavage/methylation domain-containing protein
MNPIQAQQHGRAVARRIPAFTLIELLVVIALIAILAALLFGSLSAVRDRARLTTCAANLRNIGQAIVMYAAEHDGSVPSVSAPNGDTWDTTLLPYLGSNRTVFLCRADPWLDGSDSSRSPRSYAANGGVAYAPHTEADYPFAGYGQLSRHSLERLKSKSRRLFLVGERPGDSSSQRGYVGDMGWSGMDSIPGHVHRDGQGANYLFADMGVQYMSTGEAFYADNDYWYVDDN